MKKNYYILFVIFFSTLIYSSKQSPKKQKKVSFNKEAEKLIIPFEEQEIGQIMSYSPLSEFDSKSYIQTNLIKDNDAARKQLDEISDEIRNHLTDMNNDHASRTVRFSALSKNLDSLSKIFSHIIPKEAWDNYDAQKYRLLAEQHNSLLKNTQNIAEQLEGMCHDYNQIYTNILMNAHNYLEKQKKMKKARNGNRKTKKE